MDMRALDGPQDGLGRWRAVEYERKVELLSKPARQQTVVLQRPLLRPPPGERGGQDEACRQLALRAALGQRELGGAGRGASGDGKREIAADDVRLAVRSAWV